MKYIKKMELALKVFHSFIDNCDDSRKGLKSAEKQLRKFNKAMCSLLCQAKVCSSLNKAKKSINFIRDFMWKKTWQDESFCTVIPNITDEDRGFVIRLATPMVVGNDFAESIWQKAFHIHEKDKELRSKNKGFIPLIHTWRWYEDLLSQLGSWFDTFTKDHLSVLSQIATTPMSRTTPGPANAYDSTLISVDSQGKIVQVLSGTQLAITEPSDVDISSERYKLTLNSHISTVFGRRDQRLKDVIKRQFDRWKPLLDNKGAKELDIPILHQTLIGDQVLPLLGYLIPDTKKSQTSLDYREKANEYLRQRLALHHIYYKPGATPEFIIRKRDAKEGKHGTPEDYYKIHINILETNSCINNHHRYTRVRNNDLDHSRNLIKMATVRLEQFQKMLSDSKGEGPKQEKNLSKILEFLYSSNYSFISPYKSYGDDVDNAIGELTRFLRKESTAISPCPLPKTLRNDLALLIQAATELKCTVHESSGGFVRRWFNNTIGQMFLIGTVFRLAGWIASLPFRITQLPFTLPAYFKHNTTRRKTAHKAVNEQIVAELLGEKFGGCMSSEDRGEEVEQFKEANLRAFHTRGRILGFNEEPAKKREFMEIYAKTTQEKHNFNKMSTGSPTSSDTETRPWGWAIGQWFGHVFGSAGIFSAYETYEEQRLSKKMEHLRKGVYDRQDVSIDDYIAARKELISSVRILTSVITPSEESKEETRPENTKPDRSLIDWSSFKHFQKKINPEVVKSDFDEAMRLTLS